MKILYTLLISIFCLNLIGAQSFAESLPHDGATRWYRIHLPPNYSSNSVLPLVLNFHGYGSNAQQQELYSQFSAVADTAHIIVVYPEGVDNLWNVGFGGNTDDVSFTNDLIDTIQARYNIDVESVFSTGMSNGGFMSYKLACEMTDRIQAIASVTGSIVPDQLPNCNPTDQIPVMQIHGTLDPTVAYNGSAIALPIEDVVDYWVGYDNCATPATIIPVEDIDPTDGCTAERIEYLDCDGDNEVIFYKITGGAHTWPGTPIVIGTTNQDFDASVEIWKFFYKYRSSNLFVADEDNDGFPGNVDCDDSNAAINPDQVEIAYNGIDDDCDSSTPDDDLDNDGFPASEDCDDNDVAINPNAIEIPNNDIDEDCDGMDATTSIDEIYEKFIITPNPFGAQLKIDLPTQDLIHINLLDLHGKIIKTVVTRVSVVTIDTNDIASGVYFIQAVYGNEVVVKKVVKQ